MKSCRFKLVYCIVALGISLPAMGQDSPQVDQEKGFTAIEIQ